MPLYYTEYNSGLFTDPPYHDLSSTAAFLGESVNQFAAVALLHLLLRLSCCPSALIRSLPLTIAVKTVNDVKNNVDMWSYWTFTGQSYL